MCTAFCGDKVRSSVVYFAEDGGDVNASDAYEPKSRRDADCRVTAQLSFTA
jgi:hypothetical protein